MALVAVGYDSKQVNALLDEIQLKTADLYLRKIEYRGSGVFGLSVGASTLTPATAPSWTADDYISAGSKNLVLLDDDGDACWGKIEDNDTTSITFDEAEIMKVDDSSTAATLTDTDTYQFVIWTPHATYEWCNFIGYTQDVNSEHIEETIDLKVNIPRELIRQDLLERGVKITGNILSTRYNVREAILGSSDYGTDSNQYQDGIGTIPSARDFFSLVLV